MKKTEICGYSVDETLFTGKEFYDSLGYLLGVIKDDDTYKAIMQDKEGNYFSKEMVIDLRSEMTPQGPKVSEKLYVGKSNYELSDIMTAAVLVSQTKHQNLSLLNKEEVNVDLGLKEYDNDVFVAEDEVLNYFKNLQKTYPSMELRTLVKFMPYKEMSNERIYTKVHRPNR